MGKLKVAVLGKMPRKGYSGGRYCAWMMAEALAHEGNEVYVVTNFLPEFHKDFEIYPRHKNIRTVLVRDFVRIPLDEERLDYVICIPAIDSREGFYYACRAFALAKKARFAFINFETPNWYREYTEMDRPVRDYYALRKICRYGCLVLSISKEGQRYAEAFYDAFAQSTVHVAWSPPMNSMVADSVKEEKRNQVLVFLRIQDKHKGGDDFLELLGEYMRGMECVCVVGNGTVDEEFQKEAEERVQQYGISLRFEKCINDYRKFQEIKRAKLLLYPSHFEGYGYPPVESLYCGTPCIVYDLPVLREVSGDALIYCENGDIAGMREKAEGLLRLKETAYRPVCVDTAEFAGQSERLQRLLEEHLSDERLMADVGMMARSRIFAKKYGYAVYGLCMKIRGWIVTEVIRVPKIIQYCIDHETVISKRLDIRRERWRLVKRQLEHKKIYIWGCGKAYYAIFPKYKRRIIPTGILDGNPEKTGTADGIMGNLTVQSPNVLERMEPEEIAVLISNKEGVDEIIGQLENMGIRNYHSLCMVELNACSSKGYRMMKFFREIGRKKS